MRPLPPAPGYRPAICLRWLLLSARGDVLAVRWYLRFSLSYRDVEELLAQRGIQVDHVTIFRWVQRSRRGDVASGQFTAACAATAVWRQIAKASSSNATATRRCTGSSTASS
jgi:hypothetical protein